MAFRFPFFGLGAKSAQAGRLPLPKSSGYGAGSPFFGGGRFGFRDLLYGLSPSVAAIKPEEAGDIGLNPIFAICIGWIGTSWPMAIPTVGTMAGADFKPDASPHPVTALLRRPNPSTSGKWLMWALNKDFWRRGNAYAHIVVPFDDAEPAELNYLPARCVRPVPDADGFLDHYEYTPNGSPIPIPPSRIVHFRFGIDESNALLGEPPLASAFREFVADNAASNYQAGMLKHPTPQAIFTPRIQKTADGEQSLSATEADELTRDLHDKLTTEPGKPRFLPGSLELHKLGVEPKNMAVNEAREQPETRIPALFQIPPVVLNLRVGLQQSTYNNVREAKTQAWQACLIPTQDYFAEEMSIKLLPLYAGSEGKCIQYDRSHVPELQPDMSAKRKDARDDYDTGLLTLEEARDEGGRQTDEATKTELEARAASVLPAAKQAEDLEQAGKV